MGSEPALRALRVVEVSALQLYQGLAWEEVLGAQGTDFVRGAFSTIGSFRKTRKSTRLQTRLSRCLAHTRVMQRHRQLQRLRVHSVIIQRTQLQRNQQLRIRLP